MFGFRSFESKIIALVAAIHIQPWMNKWIVKSVFWFPIQTHRTTITFSSTRYSVVSKKFREKTFSLVPLSVVFTRLTWLGFAVQVWGWLHVACLDNLLLFTCFVKWACVWLRSFLCVKQNCLHSKTKKAKLWSGISCVLLYFSLCPCLFFYSRSKEV